MCVVLPDLSPSKKKPIGGHGGKGGSVFIVASRFVKDLSLNSFVFKGDNGEDAMGRGLNGRAGKDRVVRVPLGTIVKHAIRVSCCCCRRCRCRRHRRRCCC